MIFSNFSEGSIPVLSPCPILSSYWNINLELFEVFGKEKV
jgi:hypothetical protein